MSRASLRETRPRQLLLILLLALGACTRPGSPRSGATIPDAAAAGAEASAGALDDGQRPGESAGDGAAGANEAGSTGAMAPLSRDSSRAPPAPEGSGKHVDATIGPSGGEIALDEVTLSIPPGAIETETTLSMTELAGALDPKLGHGATPLYQLEPSGLTFSEPVTVRFRKPPASDEQGLAVIWSKRSSELEYEAVSSKIVDEWVYVESHHFSYWAGVYLGTAEDDYGSCGDGALNAWPRYNFEQAQYQLWQEDCDIGEDNTTSCPYGSGPCTVCDPTSCSSQEGLVATCGDGRLQRFDPENGSWEGGLVRGANGQWRDLPAGAVSYSSEGKRYEVCDPGKHPPPPVPEACPYGTVSATACTFCSADCLEIVRLTPRYCGDGVTTNGEACDDGNNTTETCPYGDANCSACAADCSASALPHFCGNGLVDDASELCDTAVPAGNSCQKLGFPGGILACSDTCELDLSGCDPIPVSVAASDGYTCLVDSGGRLGCWGQNGMRNAEPPSGRYKQVFTAASHACALRADDTVKCWGAAGALIDPSPNEPFIQLAPGDHWSTGFTCGLRANGTIRCWDVTGTVIETKQSDGQFARIAVGDRLCGLLVGGAMTCRNPSSGSFDQPSSNYLDLSMQGSKAAWIDANGNLQSANLSSVGYEFTRASAGGATCGLTATKDIVCFEPSLSEPVIHQGPFEQVAAGSGHVCGARADGSIACWANVTSPADEFAAAVVPPGGFSRIATCTTSASGMAPLCGLRNGSIECLGGAHSELKTPPLGTFSELSMHCSAASAHACAVRSDGTLRCWGDPGQAHTTPPPGTFKAVVASDAATYGLRMDGGVACFGANCSAPMWTAASGSYSSLSGNLLVCGVATETGNLRCWGQGYDPQSWSKPLPSDGGYVEVVAGDNHGCARKLDGSVTCFGNDYLGKAQAPPEAMRQLAIGGDVSYGLRIDGGVAVWGGAATSVHTLPGQPGPFRSIAAANGYVCGLRDNGRFTCWGSQYARLP